MRKLSQKRGRSAPVRKHRRISALVFFVFFLSIALIGRLALLQIVRHDSFVALAEAQQNVSEALPTDRGEISLSDSGDPYPIAINRQYFLAYAVPSEVKNLSQAVRDVGSALGLDATILVEKLSKVDDPFEILKHRLSDEEADRIRALNMECIALLPETYRYYPGQNLAAQTIGFVGMSGSASGGQYGIEASFENELRGQTGSVVNERDASGRWMSLSGKDFVAPERGANIVLTIKRVVQYEVEKILKDAIAEFHADSGTIIVMEPKTGSILALASYPSFDPNEYSKVDDSKVFLNPAVSFSYEPGSIMKPVSMAIGIEEGKVNADTEYVDTGSVKEGGYTIHNAQNKVYGRSSMTKVLEESINTGVIFVERLVGNERFREYLGRFGFGEKTGIDLPAEISGDTRNLSDAYRSVEFFTAAFGQGITVTPIQIVNAYATIANGGVLMKPRIVERMISSDGNVKEFPPEEIRSVVSEATASEVGKMLRAVVVNGHGKRADVPGYLVVGKTGTAQVAKQDGKGYEDGMSVGSFIGYAPENDPKFVVMVKIDNPRSVDWAESSAAPTFRKVMQFLLESSGIAPTEPVK